ncbi:hypothetical protein B0H10DRAFT_1940455 [Mycena sp. CBHHK59/15]|nr:hypothetical protein B0H10DRAFT_1940455 [Mycena sp. CBHHK59/15]
MAFKPVPGSCYRIQSVNFNTFIELQDENCSAIVMRPNKPDSACQQNYVTQEKPRYLSIGHNKGDSPENDHQAIPEALQVLDDWRDCMRWIQIRWVHEKRLRSKRLVEDRKWCFIEASSPTTGKVNRRPLAQNQALQSLFQKEQDNYGLEYDGEAAKTEQAESSSKSGDSPSILATPKIPARFEWKLE